MKCKLCEGEGFNEAAKPCPICSGTGEAIEPDEAEIEEANNNNELYRKGEI